MDNVLHNALTSYGTVQIQGDWRGFNVQINGINEPKDDDITHWKLILQDYGYRAEVNINENTANLNYIRKQNNQTLFDFDEASNVWKRNTGANDPKRLKKQQQTFWAKTLPKKRKRKKPNRYS